MSTAFTSILLDFEYPFNSYAISICQAMMACEEVKI